jgi:hypothetical protein
MAVFERFLPKYQACIHAPTYSLHDFITTWPHGRIWKISAKIPCMHTCTNIQHTHIKRSGQPCKRNYGPLKKGIVAQKALFVLMHVDEMHVIWYWCTWMRYWCTWFGGARGLVLMHVDEVLMQVIWWCTWFNTDDVDNIFWEKRPEKRRKQSRRGNWMNKGVPSRAD